MKEFALVFRLKDIADFRSSPEQMQERMNWLAGLAAQDKLLDKGKTFLPMPASARTIHADGNVTEGAYTEVRDFVTGYVIVASQNIDEAIELAKANPIFRIGGSIEVREILKRD